MQIRKSIVWTSVVAGIIALGIAASASAQRHEPPGSGGGPPAGRPPDPKAILGQALFFDTDLSSPAGLSCMSCHDPGTGWADPRNARDPFNGPTSEGSVGHRAGFRNAPSLGYADYGPSFRYDADCGCYVGGRYRDGRAVDPAGQAKFPLLSRLEMNNPNARVIIHKVRRSAYAPMFEAIYGQDVWADPGRALNGVAESLAAYQASPALNRFDSRFDRFLRGDATALTADEKAGQALFEGRGGCADCHPSQRRTDGGLPLFTTFKYYNLGVPRNPDNPFYDVPVSLNPLRENFVDRGLGGVVGKSRELGKFKVPSLRNVALTPPYGHNGLFPTLDEVVQFHSSRDVDARWGRPEVPFNISIGPAAILYPAPVSAEGPQQPPDDPDPGGTTGRLGNLNLSAREIGQIVAFLRTLSDQEAPAP